MNPPKYFEHRCHSRPWRSLAKCGGAFLIVALIAPISRQDGATAGTNNVRLSDYEIKHTIRLLSDKLSAKEAERQLLVNTLTNRLDSRWRLKVQEAVEKAYLSKQRLEDLHKEHEILQRKNAALDAEISVYRLLSRLDPK